MRRQCELLEDKRNRPASPGAKFTGEGAALCQLIDQIHPEEPAFGARKIRNLIRYDHDINSGRPQIARRVRQFESRRLPAFPHEPSRQGRGAPFVLSLNF